MRECEYLSTRTGYKCQLDTHNHGPFHCAWNDDALLVMQDRR